VLRVDVTEVARLLRRYGLALALAIAIPAIALALYVRNQPATYTAHARIVAAEATPRAQAEANAVVSQVLALATSRDVIAQALDSAHLNLDPDTVARNVKATGLGSSALVDLAYTDPSPQAAQQVTRALAVAVVGRLDAVRIGGLPEVLADVDKQLTDLATKRAPIAADAQANPKDPVLQNRLAGIDRLINDLSGDRNRLSEEASAAGHATIVADPQVPAKADPRGLPAKVGVAGVAGLLVGLLIIGLIETMRPAVSGAARVARLLDVPVLGAVASDPATLADIGRRIRLAARRAGVSTVVLSRATRSPVPPELVDRIEGATLRPDAVPARVAILPLSLDDTAVLNAPWTANGRRAEPVPETNPDREAPSAGGPVALLPATETGSVTGTVRLRRVYALEELGPDVESESIGLVVLASSSTRVRDVDRVRDLMTASGWPLLGVLGDPGARRGGRR
jgi:capsular polysaccharide biosynthesis protein